MRKSSRTYTYILILNGKNIFGSIYVLGNTKYTRLSGQILGVPNLIIYTHAGHL